MHSTHGKITNQNWGTLLSDIPEKKYHVRVGYLGLLAMLGIISPFMLGLGSYTFRTAVVPSRHSVAVMCFTLQMSSLGHNFIILSMLTHTIESRGDQ